MAKTPKLKCPQCGFEHEPSKDDINAALTVVRAQRAAKQKATSIPVGTAQEQAKPRVETPAVPKKRASRAKPVARKK